MAYLKFYFSDKVKKRHNSFLDFVQKMANRLMVGLYRYGPVNKRQNYLRRIKAALKHYEETGNTEYLVDTANYCWLEFAAPSNPLAFFSSSDSQGTRIVDSEQPRQWERDLKREGD